MFLAIVAFTGEESLQVQVEKVGFYQSVDEAEQGIAIFVEEVLEIERPNYKGLTTRIISVDGRERHLL